MSSNKNEVRHTKRLENKITYLEKELKSERGVNKILLNELKKDEKTAHNHGSARHTPGAWKYIGFVKKDSGHDWLVEVAKQRYIHVEGRDANEAEANARLIAASPMLYEACKTAIEYTENITAVDGKKDPEALEYCATLKQLRQALARAGGEE